MLDILPPEKIKFIRGNVKSSKATQAHLTKLTVEKGHDETHRETF